MVCSTVLVNGTMLHPFDCRQPESVLRSSVLANGMDTLSFCTTWWLGIVSRHLSNGRFFSPGTRVCFEHQTILHWGTLLHNIRQYRPTQGVTRFATIHLASLSHKIPPLVMAVSDFQTSSSAAMSIPFAGTDRMLQHSAVRRPTLGHSAVLGHPSPILHRCYCGRDFNGTDIRGTHKSGHLRNIILVDSQFNCSFP